MRTKTPRIRQLTLQPGHAPCVLTRRTLAAVAAAPSHPFAAGRSRNCLPLVGGGIAEKADARNPNPVFLSSQEKERRFLRGPKARGFRA